MLAEDIRNVVLQVDVHKVNHPARHRFTNTMVRKEVVVLLQVQLQSRTAGNNGLVVTKHDHWTLDVCTQIAQRQPKLNNLIHCNPCSNQLGAIRS